VTQEPSQPGARRSIADLLRINCPVLIASTFSLAALVAMFDDHGQSLTPEPKYVELWSEAIAVVLGIVSCAVVMSVRPRTWKTALIAIGGSIVLVPLCWMISGILLSQIYQRATFGDGDGKSSTKYIPILLAEINRYKGTHYSIWLKSYSALLEVGEKDYVTNFGPVERVRPIGYCVHVTVQTSGLASRILTEHGRALPVGSIGRCPSTPSITTTDAIRTGSKLTVA
jgi:hypothetical protein